MSSIQRELRASDNTRQGTHTTGGHSWGPPLGVASQDRRVPVQPPENIKGETRVPEKGPPKLGLPCVRLPLVFGAQELGTHILLSGGLIQGPGAAFHRTSSTGWNPPGLRKGTSFPGGRRRRPSKAAQSSPPTPSGPHPAGGPCSSPAGQCAHWDQQQAVCLWVRPLEAAGLPVTLHPAGPLCHPQPGHRAPTGLPPLSFFN